MDSDNPSGAVNQQERPGFAQWVVGFVDGEGGFSVPIFRNRTSWSGWQVQPAYGGSGREEPRCVASNGAVLHVWSGRTSCSVIQSSRASLPFHGTEALRSVGPDHPVL